MGGGFPQGFVESVRDAADIVRVVGDYVQLKQAGRRLKGLCPFHNEKTPSFSVDPDAQLFYCFGCQTGGDLFKFVQLYEKMSFPEAVKHLAGRFGVPLPARDPAARAREDARDRLLRLNDAAAAWFRSRLADPRVGAAARAYLERRGFGDDTVESLAVGYAPDAWEGLLGHLRSQGFAEAEVVNAGLAVPRKSGGAYDRFRDRVMFPIRDVYGRTVAFGGRVMGDDQPKYINSPETPAYTKGNHLYGLDRAREAIRREGFVIVVEGYLDAAALIQAGFDNAVASLGTAFTEAQARLLGRFSRRVVVSYDGDAAGASAAAKSFDLMLGQGLEVRVVDLADTGDPDDYIREHGASAYGQLVREAPDYLTFLLRRETRGRDLSQPHEQIAVVNALLPHLARLEHAIERVSWAGRLADALGIEDALVLQDLRAALGSGSAQTRVSHRTDASTRLGGAESRLVGLLLRSETERRALVDDETWRDDLDGSAVFPIVDTIVRLTREGTPVEYPTVLGALGAEGDRDLLTRIAFREDPDDGPTVDDCRWTFRRARLQRLEREKARGLDRASDVDRHLRELQELARQRDAMSNL